MIGESDAATEAQLERALAARGHAHPARIGPGGVSCSSEATVAGQGRFPLAALKKEGADSLLVTGDAACARDLAREVAQLREPWPLALAFDASEAYRSLGGTAFVPQAGSYPDSSPTAGWYEALGHDAGVSPRASQALPESGHCAWRRRGSPAREGSRRARSRQRRALDQRRQRLRRRAFTSARLSFARPHRRTPPQPPPAMTTFPLSTPRATRELARRIAPLLERGDLVILTGPLGSGKTYFTRALCRALGLPPRVRVPSPTFTLVHEHSTLPPLSHADLYRLRDAADVRSLGLDAQRATAASSWWSGEAVHRAPGVGTR